MKKGKKRGNKPANPGHAAKFCCERREEAHLTKTCQYCNKSDCLLRCSRCRVVYYCSKECQFQDWHWRHKKDCKRYKSYRLDLLDSDGMLKVFCI